MKQLIKLTISTSLSSVKFFIYLLVMIPIVIWFRMTIHHVPLDTSPYILIYERIGHPTLTMMLWIPFYLFIVDSISYVFDRNMVLMRAGDKRRWWFHKHICLIYQTVIFTLCLNITILSSIQFAFGSIDELLIIALGILVLTISLALIGSTYFGLSLLVNNRFIAYCSVIVIILVLYVMNKYTAGDSYQWWDYMFLRHKTSIIAIDSHDIFILFRLVFLYFCIFALGCFVLWRKDLLE